MVYNKKFETLSQWEDEKKDIYGILFVEKYKYLGIILNKKLTAKLHLYEIE
jgi:hypothetical protein